MVDVMLVLIIFTVTAPLLTVGIPVNLPQTKAEPSATLTSLGRYRQRQREIFRGRLRLATRLWPRLQAITANKPDTKIFVRGDKAIDYGRVMQVMGMIKSAGFTQVALVVDMPPDKAQPGQTQPAQTQDQKKKTGK
jgi:biopolymer transport protein TolR